MAAIAERAGISTGNLYRYFPGKEALFEAVIDRTFVAELLGLLRGQVRAARGQSDLFALPNSAPHRVASEELLAFAIEHRLRVAVLLGRAAGSCYDAFAGELVDELAKRALAHLKAERPGLRVSPPVRLVVRQAYENLVATVVLVLVTYAEERHIRAALAAFSSFHLGGLRALFDRIDGAESKAPRSQTP